jgi:hypothetical protein
MNYSNIIKETEILSRSTYLDKRKSLRENMVSRKKFRRIDIGPYITIYFENKDTIIHQINEMVFIENGGKEQVKDEIAPFKHKFIYLMNDSILIFKINSYIRTNINSSKFFP